MTNEPQPSNMDVHHADNVIVGPHGQQIIHNWPPPKQPPRRHTPWLITAGVLSVIGLLAVYAVVVIVRDGSSKAPTGPELVASARIPDRDGNGFKMVVPGRYHPQVKFMTMPGAAANDEFASDLYRAGGVRLSPVDLEIVLTGQRDHEIRILNIAPIITRRGEPLGGTAFILGGQGQAPTIPMAMNFDELNPVPREVIGPRSPELKFGEPYFDRQKITLKNDEREVIFMPLRITRYSVEFTLKIDYAIGAEEKSLTLDNGGAPFVLTGHRGDPLADRADYEAAYTMRGDFSICEVDPKHMRLSYAVCR
ncbi:hypothetical protein [Nocardia xishanensis]